MAAIDISSLTTEERLDLIGELWDSLSTKSEEIPLTSAQREELDCRVTAFEHDRALGRPLGSSVDEVLDRVRASAK